MRGGICDNWACKPGFLLLDHKNLSLNHLQIQSFTKAPQ